MRELWVARIKTFFLLFLVFELVVAGGFWFYQGTITDSYTVKVSEMLTQQVKQVRDHMNTVMKGFEGITQMMMIDPQIREDVAKIYNGTYQGEELNRALTRMKDRLTTLKYQNPSVLNLRLFPREDFKKVLEPKAIFMVSFPVPAIVFTPKNEDSMREVANANGKPVWFPALEKGFFYDENVAASLYVKPYTFTLGRVLMNAEQKKTEVIVVMEILNKVFADALKNTLVDEKAKVWFVDAENKVVYDADTTKIGKESEIKVQADFKGGIVKKDEQTIVVAEKLESAPWQVVMQFPLSEYIDYLMKSAYVLLGIIAGVVFLMCIALAWLMNRNQVEYED